MGIFLRQYLALLIAYLLYKQQEMNNTTNICF